MELLLKYGLLPLVMACTIGLSLAAYLSLGKRRVRWLAILRIGLVCAVAVLLFFPSLTRESREVYRPALAVLLDTSASMTLKESSDSSSRYDRARARLQEIRRQFQEDFDINLYLFAREARRVQSEPEEALGRDTDLSTAVAHVLNREDPKSLRGVFLISDGRVSIGETPLPWARTSSVPIHAVAVGSSSFDYKDLGVMKVDAPDHLFKDSIGKARVQLKSHGIDKGVVVLEQAGRRIDQKAFSSDDARTLTFDLRPGVEGLTEYRVHVLPQDGELTELNNSWKFPVRIESQPRKVLLLPATPGWEYTFLKRQLRADPRYAVTETRQFKADEALRLPGEGIDGFGLIILNGFRKSAFDDASIAALLRYVRSGDGVLVFTGNSRLGLDALFGSELASILPVGPPSGAEEAASRFPFLPSDKSPIFRILEHEQANRQAWRALPPILVAQPGLTRLPATSILGTFPRFPQDSPGLTYRLFGRGMTVLFNTDETYLWKMLMDAANDPDHLYDRFWSNLLSWLTDESRLTGVGLTLSRMHFMLGDEVYVRVEDYAGRLGQLSREELILGYIGPDGADSRLAPEAVSGGFLASFIPQREGRYRIRLDLPGGGTVDREIQVDSVMRDFQDPLADAELMKGMADLSGGLFLADDTGGLASLRIDSTPLVKQRSESLFWLDRGWALALCLLLLVTEWLMRRRYNLM